MYFVGPEMDIGSIILWAKTAAQIPAGWQVADGTNGTLDLTDQFVRGANVDGDIGVQAGNDLQNHTFSANPHSHPSVAPPPPGISLSPLDGKLQDVTVTGTTDNADNKPAHNTAYYIQKVA